MITYVKINYVFNLKATELFLCVLAELLKVTICFNMSVCPSTWNNLASMEGFSSHLIFEYFSKGCYEIHLSLKSGMSNEYLTQKNHTHL